MFEINKVYFKNVIMFLILLIAAGGLTGCDKSIKANLTEDNSIYLDEPIYVQKNSINIMVDPRIELLSIVQFLSDYDENYGLMANYDFEYKRKVEEHFLPYRNHKAVKMFNKMSKSGCCYHVPPTTVLGMTRDFNT